MTFCPDKVDSVIFDMDGTLWNASQSYVEIWNVCLKRYGIDRHLTVGDLSPYIGMTIDGIIQHVFVRDYKTVDSAAFLRSLADIEDEMMPQLGGKLYPGVVEGFAALSRRYRLFLVSNCGVNGLNNFMAFSHTEPYVTDSVTFGQRHASKGDNIIFLKNKYSLQYPVYMGDTQSDCDEAHRAGIPFIHAKYGFGKCDDCEMSFDSFNAFTACFLNVK
jgi:phosphoglycolate phosphatase